MSDLSDEILDSEFVMRRFPAKLPWYDSQRGLMAEAFKPHRTSDGDGLSISRIASLEHPEFLTPMLLAESGLSKDGYFVAILSVKDLRQAGLQLERDPMPDNPGHALIVNMKSDNRESPKVAQWTQLMAVRFTKRVEGPFNSRTESKNVKWAEIAATLSCDK